ncbi:MAG: 4-(cytidine 5'-diphospho)-2-C-methyl-D-erythritol kinase [Paludibacter sp.]|nr:4-(cytidine 5'-diphospho)-2-C-methyl-D-erythritol kinase [Paludibacter sp.]
MIFFPNCKINIGLNVIKKRTDGYHNIETVFFPVSLTDILQIEKTNDKNDFSFSVFGNKIEGNTEDNLVIKALRLLQKDFSIPALNIKLTKNIPTGAGLGGGSADAAFMLKGINNLFDLRISDEKLESYAAQLGADCTFFVRNKTVFAEGTGNVFSSVNISLQGYYIVIVKPDIHIATAEEYAAIIPKKPEFSLLKAIYEPIDRWKELIFNDFEKSVFAKFPQIAAIKQQLYDCGAIYAAMSGSGSAVYGIFSKKIEFIEKFFKGYFLQTLKCNKM